VVCHEPSGIRPVAGREPVSHGVDDLPAVGEPSRGPAVQIRNLRRQGSAKLQVQEVRQQLVVAKPGALSVERDDKCVGFLQFQEHLLRARPACKQIGELTVHPI
jgi:hypothetical protein